MIQDKKDSHPSHTREPNQQQKKSTNPIDFEPVCNTLSSKQIAENVNFALKSSKNQDKAVYLTMLNYFNLEAEILPKKYSKDELHSIIDASSEAIKNGSSQKLISVYLKKTFALRTRKRKKNSK